MESSHSIKRGHGLLSEPQYDYSYHRLSAYDPNLCSTARLSPPYGASGNGTFQNHSTYENIILIPNDNSSLSGQVLEQNSIINEREHQTFEVNPVAQTYTETDYERSNIDDENTFNVQGQHSDTGGCDDQQAFHLISTHQQSDVLSSYQNEEGVSKITAPEIILHRSPNGHLYQNFYVGDQVKESTLVELVHVQNNVDVCQSQYIAYKADNISPVEYENYQTKLNTNEFISSLPDNELIHLESSIIPATASDEYLREPYVMHGSEANSLGLGDKDPQRLLLESTMSPLLAAVNDITQREAELQYFNQNLVKENNLDLFGEICDTKRPDDVNVVKSTFPDHSDIKDAVDNTDIVEAKVSEDDDYVLVADKPIESRARASLPTKYLYFGKSDELLNEPLVFARRQISLRTKFGPLEGEICLINDAVLDMLRIQTPRTYPLLVLEQSRILEVANENTSNWMRFVRMALTPKEQNVLLYHDSGKLYFRCCQDINPKEELRVGYSKEYAERHGLMYLGQPTQDKFDFSKITSDPESIRCDNKVDDITSSQENINEPSFNSNETLNSNGSGGSNSIQTTKRRVKRKSYKITRRQLSNTKLKLVLNEDCLSDQTEINVHKCNVCYKKFNTASKLENHRLAHIKNETKIFQCSICLRKCSTPAALTSHVKSHSNRQFKCVFCPEMFKRVTDFKRHVNIHSSNGMFTCQYCKKKYKEYYLVRKHVKIFHRSVKISCNECGRQFLNMTFLRRHKVSHSNRKDFLCSQCGKQYKRKDKLREHIIRMHSTNKQTKCKRKHANYGMRKSMITKQRVSRKDNDKKLENTLKLQEQVDYQRFIYKCVDCMLGFKRRGMLVNHMAKRHPEISIETIPELNQPILKPQSLFYCQYCSKIYKSNAKRKLHILKNHPGQEVPPSLKSNPEAAQIYSKTVGNLRTEPHRCQWCYKQYASKNRLLIHYRKQHPGIAKEKHDIITNDIQPPNSPENKLLKLSSAALELSSIEDKKFFDFLNEKSNHSLTESQCVLKHNSNGILHHSNDNASSFSKVGVNFKMIESEFNEASSNGDLNRLPQLFEESMACI